MKALIYQNKVVQLDEVEFPVFRDLVWVEIPEGVTVNDGDQYRDGVFSPQEELPPSGVEINDNLKLLNALAQYSLGVIEKGELQAVYDTFAVSTPEIVILNQVVQSKITGG